MSIAKKNNNNKKSQKGQLKTADVAVSTLPRQILNKTHTFMLRAVHGNLTSSGTGVVTDVVTDDPSSIADWSSISSLFDGYRVLTMAIEFFPYFVGSVDQGSMVNFPPLYVVYDTDTTSAVTSVSNALEYDNCKVMSPAKQWTLTTKVPRFSSVGSVSRVTSDGFIDVAGVQANSSFSWYADAFTTNLSYGRLVKHLLVEMRYRR
jgi:hypothetical protein